MSELNIKVEQAQILKRDAPFDLNLFAGLTIPEEMSVPYPESFNLIWKYLVTRLIQLNGAEQFNYGVGIPRGFCKTTLLKLLIVLCAIYKIRTFVLWVGATEELAINAVEDISNILKSSQVASLWGSPHFVRDTRTQKIIEYDEKSHFILVPVGAMTKVRGINVYNKRPDLIAADDIQSRENARSEVESENLIGWFWSTLYFTMVQGSNKGTALIYAGNYLEGNCILHDLHQSPEFVTFITSAILENKESLWPEYQPVESLMRQYRTLASVGKASEFLAEKLNLHPGDVSTELVFTETVEHPQASFIVIDPAGHSKGRVTDSLGAVVHLRYQEYWGVGEHKVYTGDRKEDMKTIAHEIVRMAVMNNSSHIFIESGSFVREFRFWLLQAMTEYELIEEKDITVDTISHRGTSKERRAQEFLLALKMGSWAITNRETFNALRRIMPGGKFKEIRGRQDTIIDIASYGPMALGQHKELNRIIQRNFIANRLKITGPIRTYEPIPNFVDDIPLRLARRH